MFDHVGGPRSRPVGSTPNSPLASTPLGVIPQGERAGGGSIAATVRAVPPRIWAAENLPIHQIRAHWSPGRPALRYPPNSPLSTGQFSGRLLTGRLQCSSIPPSGGRPMYWIAPDELAPSSVALCVQSRVLVQQSRRRIVRRHPVQGASDAEPWKLDNQIDQHGNPICPVCSQAILPASSVGHLDGFMVHLRCWVAG